MEHLDAGTKESRANMKEDKGDRIAERMALLPPKMDRWGSHYPSFFSSLIPISR